MSATITRTAWTDDDGTGLTGTPINNAEKTTLYNQIDDAIASAAPGAYTTTWGNTGTANALNNGTLVASFQQCGKRVFFRITLTWGSTTTSGSGNWTFSLPVTGANSTPLAIINAFAQDSSAGGAAYGAFGFLVSTTTLSILSLAAPGVLYNSTTPFTWANGDVLNITGMYFAA